MENLRKIDKYERQLWKMALTQANSNKIRSG